MADDGMGDRLRMSRLSSFLRGFGSILNMWPAPNPIRRRSYPSVADAWAEDGRKLSGDWGRALYNNQGDQDEQQGEKESPRKQG